MLPTIAREGDEVVMVDQRKLPAQEIYVRCKTAPEVARAIKTMVIRGAPAIGVAAAMGLAIGMRKSKATGTQKFAAEFFKLCELMASTRPTAVNLFWAIERMKRAVAQAATAGESVDQIKDRLDREAAAIHDEDVAACRAIGAFGAEVMPAEANVLAEAILPTQAIPADAPSVPAFPADAESALSPAFDTVVTDSVPALGVIDTVPAIVTQAAPPEDVPVTTTWAGTDPSVTSEPVG